MTVATGTPLQTPPPPADPPPPRRAPGERPRWPFGRSATWTICLLAFCSAWLLGLLLALGEGLTADIVRAVSAYAWPLAAVVAVLLFRDALAGALHRPARGARLDQPHVAGARPEPALPIGTRPEHAPPPATPITPRRRREPPPRDIGPI